MISCNVIVLKKPECYSLVQNAKVRGRDTHRHIALPGRTPTATAPARSQPSEHSPSFLVVSTHPLTHDLNSHSSRSFLRVFTYSSSLLGFKAKMEAKSIQHHHRAEARARAALKTGVPAQLFRPSGPPAGRGGRREGLRPPPGAVQRAEAEARTTAARPRAALTHPRRDLVDCVPAGVPPRFRHRVEAGQLPAALPRAQHAARRRKGPRPRRKRRPETPRPARAVPGLAAPSRPPPRGAQPERREGGLCGLRRAREEARGRETFPSRDRSDCRRIACPQIFL